MKPEVQHLEAAFADSSWISSVELGAGIFLLDGRTHLAGHSSPAARSLVARGALLVASVRFDRCEHESYHAARSIRLLPPRGAAAVFPCAGGSC